MSKSKSKGAVRKEDGAKAPDSPAAIEAKEPIADEVPGGAAAPVVDLAAEIAAIEAATVIPGHFIAEGKCISCKKGNLVGGAEVKAEYFGVDGAAILERLVESGAVKVVK